MAKTRYPAGWVWTFASLWLFAVVASMVWLERYSEAAGLPADARDRWPSDSKLPAPTDRPVLVMTVHPQCACSRASLAELEQLMAGRSNRMSVIILLSCPVGAPSDWTDTSLSKHAAAIPGARVVVDRDNLEALRFGAKTSGQTFLFDVHGRRIFAGGITSARGHEGDNAGLDAIADLVDAKSPARAGRPISAELTTPVFGCPLFSPGEQGSSCFSKKP